MLQVSIQKRAALRGRARAAAVPKGDEAKAPPVIVAPAPHPVFGWVPKDAAPLRQQPLFMLNHWHKKATTLKSKHEAGTAEYAAMIEVQGEIYEATLMARPRNAREAASQIAIVARQAMDYGVNVLSVAELKTLSDNFMSATAPEQPSKRPGPFTRGRKLTRAGLLFRYQSFLTQELMTIGWELYGNPNVALTYIPFDHEVTKRCSADFKDGKYHPRRPSRRKHHPFLDEAKLTARARSVLGSLKIDTIRRAD